MWKSNSNIHLFQIWRYFASWCPGQRRLPPPTSNEGNTQLIWLRVTSAFQLIITGWKADVDSAAAELVCEEMCLFN